MSAGSMVTALLGFVMLAGGIWLMMQHPGETIFYIIGGALCAAGVATAYFAFKKVTDRRD